MTFLAEMYAIGTLADDHDTEHGGTVNTCAYCVGNGPECYQHSEDAVYACTRPTGHVGLHVACDDQGDHEIDTWGPK